MPFPSEHRARQLPPGDHVQFKRQAIDQAPDGVEGIFGVRGDETMELVEVIFNADTWAPAVAKRWLDDRGFKSGGFQVANVAEVQMIVAQDAKGSWKDRRVNVARFDHLPAEGAVDQRTVRRWDVSPLEKPVKSSLGLRAQGMITRSGVFVYTLRDGTKMRELRPPEEVFDPSSLDSFALVPLTNDHPPDNLTQDSVAKYQVGAVGMPTKQGDHVKADILITDGKTIADVEAGKSQLSCGYTCQVLDHSGVYTDSAGVDHRFDAVQRQIRGNHVAIVDQARAGPTAAIRVDAADGFTALDEQEEGTDEMELVEVKIGDTIYKVPQAVADALKAKGDEDPPKDPPAAEDEPAKDPPVDEDAKADSATVAKLKGKIAVMEAEAAKRADAKRADADTAKINARIELLAKAQPILGVKLDDLHKLTSDQIQRAVVAKQAPSVKLDGASADFVAGVFEHITSTTQKKVDTASALAGLVGDAKDQDAKDSDRDLAKRADQARDDMITNMTLAYLPEDERKARLDQIKARA